MRSDGIELDEKQLDMIAGGNGTPKWDDLIETAYTDQCPYCGSKNVVCGCGIGADAVRACKDRGKDRMPVRLKNTSKSS